MIKILMSIISILKAFRNWSFRFKTVKLIVRAAKYTSTLFLFKFIWTNLHGLYRVFMLLSAALVLIVSDFSFTNILAIFIQLIYSIPEIIMNSVRSLYDYLAERIGYKQPEPEPWWKRHQEVLKTRDEVQKVLDEQYPQPIDRMKVRTNGYWDHGYPIEDKTWGETVWSYKYYILTVILLAGLGYAGYHYSDVLLGRFNELREDLFRRRNNGGDDPSPPSSSNSGNKSNYSSEEGIRIEDHQTPNAQTDGATPSNGGVGSSNTTNTTKPGITSAGTNSGTSNSIAQQDRASPFNNK